MSLHWYLGFGEVTTLLRVAQRRRGLPFPWRLTSRIAKKSYFITPRAFASLNAPYEGGAMARFGNQSGTLPPRVYPKNQDPARVTWCRFGRVTPRCPTLSVCAWLGIESRFLAGSHRVDSLRLIHPTQAMGAGLLGLCRLHNPRQSSPRL